MTDEQQDPIVSVSSFRGEEHHAILMALSMVLNLMDEETEHGHASHIPVEARLATESVLIKMTQHNPADRAWCEQILHRRLHTSLALISDYTQYDPEIAAAVRSVLHRR